MDLNRYSLSSTPNDIIKDIQEVLFASQTLNLFIRSLIKHNSVRKTVINILSQDYTIEIKKRSKYIENSHSFSSKNGKRNYLLYIELKKVDKL